MSEITIFHFKDKNLPHISQVGGKGFSLIKMTQVGLAIPPGFILTVSFFRPWILQLKALDAWKAFLSSSPKNISQKINEVKAQCMNLFLTEEQNSSLKEALSHYPDVHMFAVRSSSPEEDLAGASFAGGYETILGVKLEAMFESIKKTFASCLDYRVFVYKKEKGFPINDFSIAIVIMAQIASEISGVGFSLNPLNNDYDEAVFNSNWGLGETVVAGLCNPDQYIINKVNKTLIDIKIGKKETQIWLKPDGGTFEKEDPRHEEQSLKDHHLKELVEQILIIEKYYNQPMDIEWAIEKEVLYILQARPITSHLELPEIMITKPEEPRNLYLDITLTIQGFEKPVSVFGADILEQILSEVGLKLFGSREIGDLRKGIFELVSGKIFFNLSNIWSKIDSKVMSNNFKKMNYDAGVLMEEVDSKIYSRRQVPYAINFWKLGMAWRLPVIKLAFPYFFMNRIKKNIENGVRNFNAKFDTVKKKREEGKISIANCLEILKDQFAILFSQYLIPAFLGGIFHGQNKLDFLFEKFKDQQNIKESLSDLGRCLPNNVTTEMGLKIFQLTKHFDKEKFQKFEDFKQDFDSGKFLEKFYKDWKNFIENYGFRGEGEIDVRNIRYREAPEVLLAQIHSLLINSTPENNPEHYFEEAEKKRKIAYGKLREIADKNSFGRDFEKAFQVMYNLAGFRETHKYFVVKIVDYLKIISLDLAEKLISKGILKSKDQIFDLTLQNIIDIETGKIKPTAKEIEQIIIKNLQINNLYLKWPRAPSIIDSRGRIPNLKKKSLKPGELEGQSVSYGKVKGFVKVMKTSIEKPFFPGEILVAKATDPGWTPLIINAGGILLEVGGMLQHGALVSREFGKPCIVGIDNVTKILKDGDEVEIDATIGVVKIIKKESFDIIEEEKKE